VVSDIDTNWTLLFGFVLRGLDMVRRKDLVGIADKNYHERSGEFMFCSKCGNEIGGSRGDYWQVSMDYVFKCECGNEDLQLVRRVCRLVPVK